MWEPNITFLTEDLITEDFIETLSALREVNLTVEKAREIFRDYNQTIFVALINGRVGAAATLVVEKKFIHSGGFVGHIEDVAVRKDLQLKGIGSALIKYVVDYARSLDLYKIILDCKPELAEFYEINGFRLTKEINMRVDLNV